MEVNKQTWVTNHPKQHLPRLNHFIASGKTGPRTLEINVGNRIRFLSAKNMEACNGTCISLKEIYEKMNIFQKPVIGTYVKKRHSTM